MKSAAGNAVSDRPAIPTARHALGSAAPPRRAAGARLSLIREAGGAHYLRVVSRRAAIRSPRRSGLRAAGARAGRLGERAHWQMIDGRRWR